MIRASTRIVETRCWPIKFGLPLALSITRFLRRDVARGQSSIHVFPQALSKRNGEHHPGRGFRGLVFSSNQGEDAGSEVLLKRDSGVSKISSRDGCVRTPDLFPHIPLEHVGQTPRSKIPPKARTVGVGKLMALFLKKVWQLGPGQAPFFESRILVIWTLIIFWLRHEPEGGFSFLFFFPRNTLSR